MARHAGLLFGAGLALFPILAAGAGKIEIHPLLPESDAEAQEEASRVITLADALCGCPVSAGKADVLKCGYRSRQASDDDNDLVMTPIFSAAALALYGMDDERAHHAARDLWNWMPLLAPMARDLSGFRWTELPAGEMPYGQCLVRVDYAGHTADPGPVGRGSIARLYLYFHDKWGMSLADSQLRIFKSWSAAARPTEAELDRAVWIWRIEHIENPYVPVPALRK